MPAMLQLRKIGVRRRKRSASSFGLSPAILVGCSSHQKELLHMRARMACTDRRRGADDRGIRVRAMRKLSARPRLEQPTQGAGECTPFRLQQRLPIVLARMSSPAARAAMACPAAECRLAVCTLSKGGDARWAVALLRRVLHRLPRRRWQGCGSAAEQSAGECDSVPPAATISDRTARVSNPAALRRWLACSAMPRRCPRHVERQ